MCFWAVARCVSPSAAMGITKERVTRRGGDGARRRRLAGTAVEPNWTRGAGRSLSGTTGGVQAELLKLSSLPAVIYRPAGLKKLILAALLVPYNR